jgi:glutamyl-tRNA synthetase
MDKEKIPLQVTSHSSKKLFEESSIVINEEKKFEKVLELVKERCTLLPDFLQQASFFFQSPFEIDVNAVKPKWDEKKNLFFAELIRCI